MSDLATSDTTAGYAAALDAADPLAALRCRVRRRRHPPRLLRRQLAGPPARRHRRPAARLRGGRVGRTPHPRLGRALVRPAAHPRRRDRPGVPRCGSGPDDRRRLDDRAALQAGPCRGRRPSGPRRDRHRLRQLPHRPLHRRGDRRRAGPDRALDRGRPRGGRHRRAGPRRRGGADRGRGAQPGRLPLGTPGRRRGDHAGRPRRRRPRRLGPLPLGRVRARRARPLGRGPRRRLHLQVPQRRSRVAGVRLRRPAPPRRLVRPAGAAAADPGLDGARRPVPHGAGLPAGRRHPPLHLRHARRWSACSPCRTCSR